MPHLHWHVIPRYADDPHFPQPIWGTPQRAVDAATRASEHRGARRRARRGARLTDDRHDDARHAARPSPTEIKLHQKSQVLEISFADGKSVSAACPNSCACYSPSAEVRGHGPGQEVLQVGKKDVQILAVEPVGQYAVQFRFSDGHDTGIYSWDLLYDYGERQDAMWQQYLERG